MGQPTTEKSTTFVVLMVRESASSCKVSTGDDEAVFRTHAPSRLALGAVFDESTDHQHTEKEKAGLLSCFLCVGEEYWHMDEPISREKADLLCRSISLAFSGVKLIVSIASEKLYVIISLSG